MFEPLGNTTVLPPAEWHPEPKFRGTFSILSSCLITMALCIWTSLHLNLPEHKKEYQQKYRKLGWMILGLLSPELVVWNAWEQRKQANELSALMKEKGFMPEKLKTWKRMREGVAKAWHILLVFLLLKAEDWPEPMPLHIRAWTDVHSWLVVMGGMAFEDNSPEDQQFMQGSRRRMPLTLDMLKWLANHRPHLIPDISREQIEDKSKSDWLAKLLTCWQASYFCAQCAFRLSQRLSVTVLELNVFAHAVCALLLFLIWWDKPRDVHEPSAITSEEALDLCACISHSETVWSSISFDGVFHPPPIEKCFMIARPTNFTARRKNRLSVAINSGEEFSTARGHYNHFVTVMGPVEYDYLMIRDTYWRLMPRPHSVVSDEAAVTLTGRDIGRLVRVYRSLTETPLLLQSIKSVLRPMKSGNTILDYRASHDRISNWTLVDDCLEIFFGPDENSTQAQANYCWLLGGVTFAGACYGGLHLVAWASAFPSRAEAMMWRAASVTILATGPWCAFITACMIGSRWTFKLLKSPKLQATSKIVHCLIKVLINVFLVALVFLSLLWYVLCRAFIVVECFVLLAHIPETALHVPAWTAYVPSFH
jgi:hypothetical protein